MFFFLLAGMPAWAAAPAAASVGRVAAIDGTLALRLAGASAGTAARADSAVNDPVFAGEIARTDAKSRAALRIGPEMIALAPDTEIEIARLDADRIQLTLRNGRIALRLSRLGSSRTVEVRVPRGAVWLSTAGDYDIVAGDARAPSRVAVFQGQARFVGQGLDRTVGGGDAVLFNGGLAKGETPVAGAERAAADDFDIWWRRAYGDDPDPRALHYVSAELTGYDALDANGTWNDIDGYGAVWFPKAVAADWSPYRFGHWRWIAPWGWTWIDNAVWGFAPSHYGRWSRIPMPGSGEERWGWVPGKPGADPSYMPAVVSFIGTAGVGLSVPNASGPAIAWFPLAPGEAYWPGYQADLATIRRINQGSVSDVSEIGPAAAGGSPPAAIINGVYINRRFATVVPRAVFAAGRPVENSLIRLPQRRIENAPLLAGSPQIPPATATAPTVVASAPIPPAPIKLAMQILVHVAKPIAKPREVARRPAGRFAHLAVLAHRARAWRQHVIAVSLARRGAHHNWRLAVAHRR